MMKMIGLLAAFGSTLFSIVAADARAPSIMDSPGYQRRLQESRQQLQQPYATPEEIDPRQRLETPRKARRKLRH